MDYEFYTNCTTLLENTCAKDSNSFSDVDPDTGLLLYNACDIPAIMSKSEAISTIITSYYSGNAAKAMDALHDYWLTIIAWEAEYTQEDISDFFDMPIAPV